MCKIQKFCTCMPLRGAGIAACIINMAVAFYFLVVGRSCLDDILRDKGLPIIYVVFAIYTLLLVFCVCGAICLAIAVIQESKPFLIMVWLIMDMACIIGIIVAIILRYFIREEVVIKNENVKEVYDTLKPTFDVVWFLLATNSGACYLLDARLLLDLRLDWSAKLL